jgi:hypothetical protein
MSIDISILITLAGKAIYDELIKRRMARRSLTGRVTTNIVASFDSGTDDEQKLTNMDMLARSLPRRDEFRRMTARWVTISDELPLIGGRTLAIVLNSGDFTKMITVMPLLATSQHAGWLAGGNFAVIKSWRREWRREWAGVRWFSGLRFSQESSMCR